MSTSSKPSEGRAAVARALAHPALPWLALAALCTAAFAVTLRAVRGQTFFGDEWAFLLHRDGFSPSTFLTPHGQHPVAVPVALYKALQSIFGMEHYAPYALAVIALHLATCVVLYVYARPRVGPWLALVPAALLLFLGAAWESIIWAFQVTILGSVGAGLAALVALDARRPRLAAAALLVAVLCSGLALAFLVAAAVEIAVDPRRRRQEWWVIAVPVAALAVVFVGFPSPIEIPASSLSHTVRFAFEMAAAGFGAFGGLGPNWGRPLAVAALLGLVYVARRDGVLAPRAVGLLLGAAVYWLLTGRGRADFGVPPDSSRYLYLSALLILALAVTVPRRPAVGPWAGAVLAGIVALLCVSGAGLFKEASAQRLLNPHVLLPKLTALEVARGQVAPGFAIDPASSPDLTAREYYAAREKFGTPAEPLATLRRDSDERRQYFDGGLVSALGLALAPGTAPEAGAPPAVERATGGTARPDGACVAFHPDAPQAAVELTLSPGGRYALSGGAAALQLRRLADGYGPAMLTLNGGEPATLALPRDRLNDPWHLRLVADTDVRVCGAGS